MVALYPWLMLPVVPVIIVVLAFNFLGDGLRDAADPYERRSPLAMVTAEPRRHQSTVIGQSSRAEDHRVAILPAIRN